MVRLDFYAGHVFMDGDRWTLFIKYGGFCGNSGMEELLNHWKISDAIRLELERQTAPRKGDQLELF